MKIGPVVVTTPDLPAASVTVSPEKGIAVGVTIPPALGPVPLLSNAPHSVQVTVGPGGVGVSAPGAPGSGPAQTGPGPTAHPSTHPSTRIADGAAGRVSSGGNARGRNRCQRERGDGRDADDGRLGIARRGSGCRHAIRVAEHRERVVGTPRPPRTVDLGARRRRGSLRALGRAAGNSRGRALGSRRPRTRRAQARGHRQPELTAVRAISTPSRLRLTAVTRSGWSTVNAITRPLGTAGPSAVVPPLDTRPMLAAPSPASP